MARKELEKKFARIRRESIRVRNPVHPPAWFVSRGRGVAVHRINAGHRQAALVMMAELIDRLKQDVRSGKFSNVLNEVFRLVTHLGEAGVFV